MIKKLRISCLGILLALGAICIYGNIKIKHLDFDTYISDSDVMYDIAAINDMVINYPYFKDIIIDDKINSYSDLLNISANILVVTIEDVEFAGSGIINECLVKDVIKSDEIKTEERINIYSHTDFVSYNGAVYVDGSLPLIKGESYVISIEKAPNPNVSGAYMFNSFKYGFFKLKENPRYLLNFESDTNFSLKDAIEYEYITTGDDINLYDSIYKEVNSMYDSKIAESGE